MFSYFWIFISFYNQVFDMQNSQTDRQTYVFINIAQVDMEICFFVSRFYFRNRGNHTKVYTPFINKLNTYLCMFSFL